MPPSVLSFLHAVFSFVKPNSTRPSVVEHEKCFMLESCCTTFHDAFGTADKNNKKKVKQSKAAKTTSGKEAKQKTIKHQVIYVIMMMYKPIQCCKFKLPFVGCETISGIPRAGQKS